MTPEEVLLLYGRAWFERDRDQRIEALRRACTEDILFVDPELGRLHGLAAVADMIGSYMNPPMEGHETEDREEHARGMSASGVSVEVVTPVESFHQFYRYSYIWHFPDGSSSGGTSFCEQAPDGRIRLITVWPGSDHFPIPPHAAGLTRGVWRRHMIPAVPLDFSKGAALLGQEEVDAVAAVVASRSLFRYKGGHATGAVADFERAASRVLGSTFGVAVANGTAALRCALAALGVRPGDEVIVPAFTFIATVNAVVAAGAVPVFAEIDDTLGLDPTDVERHINERTAAVIVVHLENAAADLDALLPIADRHDVAVIEDTAQAFGATYHARALGTFGALGAYSLQQEKNITAGEGGLIVTDDERLYLRATRYSDQGGQFVTSYMSERGDELTEPFGGENLRMGELAGAVAGVQLRRLPEILRRMRANKTRILETIGEAPGLMRRRLPDPEGDGGSSITWFLRDSATAKRFAALLRDEGVPAAQMYRGRPVYLNPAVLARRTAAGHYPTAREYGPGLCPQTEALIGRSLIVPVGVAYSEADCEHVGTTVRKLAEQHLS